MVIHTPRLCGEPGFRTRLEQREEAPIRCREVLDTPEAVAEATHPEMGESEHPLSRRSSHQKQHRIERAAHSAQADETPSAGDKSKAEKLLARIAKEFGKRGCQVKVDDMFVSWDEKSGKSKGFVYIHT